MFDNIPAVAAIKMKLADDAFTTLKAFLAAGLLIAQSVVVVSCIWPTPILLPSVKSHSYLWCVFNTYIIYYSNNS